MKKEAFFEVCQGSNNQKNFDTPQIINMDKVLITFDCSPNKTVHLKGDKTINIVSTGNEKSLFMCVLACTANGQKTKPLLIKVNFPNYVVSVNERGWMCKTVMIEEGVTYKTRFFF